MKRETKLRGFELLKFARAFRGFTQDELAMLYGVSRRKLQRWEKGTVAIPYDDLNIIVTDLCKLDLAKIQGVASGE